MKKWVDNPERKGSQLALIGQFSGGKGAARQYEEV